MRSIIELLIALAISAAFFVGLGFMLPSKGRIERTIDVERPAVHVFDLVNSTRRFGAWEAWTMADTDADVTFSEAADGVGARASWTSVNKAVGTGSHEIIAATPLTEVKYKVQLGERSGLSTINIEPLTVGVKVKMSFEAEFDGIMERYRGLYLDSEQGDKLNITLAGIKATLENAPYATDYAEAGVMEKEMPASPALMITGTAKGYSTSPLNVPRDRQVAIEALQTVVAQNQLTAQAPQFVEQSRDPINYIVVFDVTVPVDRIEGVRLSGDVKAVTTVAGKYLVAKHVGNRENWHLPGQTRDKIMAYASVRDIRVAGAETGRKTIAEYLSAPGTLEAQFETNVYVPVE
jgi:Polyketide cyclase / dehydrase and lipid transport